MVVVSCSALACGGSLQRDDAPAADAGTKTTLSAPLPPDTPYGAWDLVALDGMPGGGGSTQTIDDLVLELRSDGNAIARKCTRSNFDASIGAFRCSDANAYACFYGTVVKESKTWRVDIPDLRSPTVPERGEIVLEAKDTMVVRYMLPKYAAGHFTRVTDVPPTSACPGP